MSEAMNEKEEKSGSLRTILIVVLIVLLVPILTVGILYATSDAFKQSTNNVLSVLPGPAGSYFRSLPSPEDQVILKQQIAKHYITMDVDRIVDKLLVIKAENEGLYGELLFLMNRENPRKMSDVTEKLQLALINDDTLLRILGEVEQEQLARSSEISTYLNSLRKPLGIEELKRMIDNGEIKNDELGTLFQQLPIDTGAFYLRYMDASLVQQIRNGIPGSLMANLDKEVTRQLSHDKDLNLQAQLYERRRSEELVPLLTTEDEHPIADLAYIYHQLSLDKAGKVLARSESQEFIQRLTSEMTMLETLLVSREGKTRHLAEALSLHQEYNRRVQELAGVYQRMELEELAPLVERMIVSNTIVTQHVFSPDEQIVITEEQLVLDALNRMRPALISELLGQLSTPRAVLLSQKMYGD